MFSIADQTSLHTTIWINGVKLYRCLIVSRSEINVIYVKDVTKHGFEYELGGIQKISGFNGSTSVVDGMMKCRVQLAHVVNRRKLNS